MTDPKTQTPAQNESSKQAAPQGPDDASARSKKQRELDEQAKQTFPASDAPAGWAGKDIAPQDRPGAQRKG